MEALSLLIKPASSGCNMRCRYCFYADVANRRAVKNYGVMSLDTLEKTVQNALAEAEQFVAFGFQGGEPLLAGPAFFRAFTAFVEQYNTRGVECAFTVQTNGSLVDGEWADFFAQNNFLVGLSVDGCKNVHDANRLDGAGKPTYSRCMKAAEKLKAAGADFNILSVVTGEFARHPEQAYNFYKKNGFRFVQLIPCMDGLGEGEAQGFSPSAREYGRFLCRFFDLWYDDFIRGDYTSVRVFDNWVRMLMGQEPENCGMAGKCAPYPVVEADGSVYPCDFYVLDEHRLGNVNHASFAEMLGGETAARFAAPSFAVPEECRQCEYGILCRCGCRRDREPLGALNTPNRYCEGYKIFFAHAMPRMADIARKMPR